MSKQVGGLMSGAEVGQAFETLISEGQSGDVMALWKDSPPYYIPDTSMATFIGFTTCAMAFRLVPSVLTPRSLRAWPHMLACMALGLLLMWLLLGQLTIWMGSVVSKTNG